MPNSMAEQLQQDMECEGLLECIYGLKQLDKVCFRVLVESDTYQYEDTARGKAMKTEGFVKVLIEPDGEILVCHIVGPGASNLIEEVVVAMKAGTRSVWDIRESVHVHPALLEVVDRAFSGQFTRRGAGTHEHHHREHGHHDHADRAEHDHE